MSIEVPISEIPPYGFINLEFMEDAEKAIPPGFLINGKAASLRQYQVWVEQLANEVGDVIWPRYEWKTRSWQGGAADTAMALTQADFELLGQLKHQFLAPIQSRGPGTTHSELFLEEDRAKVVLINGRPASANPAHSYGLYDDQLPKSLAATISKVFMEEGIPASGSLDIQLKVFLQRPRAFQVALMLGHTGFDHHWARTAASPAMVSGHALQSAVAACQVYLTLGSQLESIPGALRRWSQFAVDMGDRRVFAGVHYPSDNIASWWCALRLARHVFGSRAAEARKFLWNALELHSTVFKALKLVAEPGTPYAEPMAWLAREAMTE